MKRQHALVENSLASLMLEKRICSCELKQQQKSVQQGIQRCLGRRPVRDSIMLDKIICSSELKQLQKNVQQCE